MQHILLTLLPGAGQQDALHELVNALPNPESPSYHQWLTPEPYGEHLIVCAWAARSSRISIHRSTLPVLHQPLGHAVIRPELHSGSCLEWERLWSGLWVSGDGVSTSYPKPFWQTGTAVPADRKRDVPDVSLGAAGHDGYLNLPKRAASTSSVGPRLLSKPWPA
jgi:hypothetical protein